MIDFEKLANDEVKLTKKEAKRIIKSFFYACNVMGSAFDRTEKSLETVHKAYRPFLHRIAQKNWGNLGNMDCIFDPNNCISVYWKDMQQVL
jgi:hypothetical protein